MKIKPEPLTAESFVPYGDVIEFSDAIEPRIINYGNTQKFGDLADLDVLAEGGKPVVSLFKTEPLPRPLSIRVMERHPLSSQAFYPLGDQPYLVVVATPGEFDIQNVRAFLAAPGQGVNYHKGTWHHYSLSLNEVSPFLVIDRGAEGKNCDEVFIDEGVLEIEY